jgi:hypothetical protein
MIERRQKMKRIIFFILFLSLIYSKSVFLQEKFIPQVLIPYSEKVPVIDGIIEDKEWEKACVITGFTGATGQYSGVIAPGIGFNTFAYLMHNNENLFIGIIYKNLEKKPSKNYRKRDEPVYLDNPQVELWLTPPAEGNLKGYQLIVNGYNAIFDAEHIPALGVERTAWNGNWIVKSSYKDKKWMVEIAVPFETLGVKDIKKDNLWKGMIGIAWPQCSFPYTFGWYKNIQAHADFIFSQEGTCVKINDLSSLLENKLKTEFEIINDKSEEKEFNIYIEAGNSVVYNKSFKVKGKDKTGLKIDEVLPEISKNTKQSFMVKIGTSDKVLFSNKWNYSLYEEIKKSETKVEEEKWQMKTRINFAPISLALYTWCDLLDYPYIDKLKTVRFEVVSPEKKVIVGKDIEKFEYDSAESYIWLPKEIKYGKYEVHTKFIGKDGNILEEKVDTFEHRNLKKEFIWLGNNFGKNIKVTPPFEKIGIKEKNNPILSVWGREIEFKGVFPERIKNQGEEMLADSIKLFAESGNKSITAVISKPIKITKKSDERVDFTGEYRIENIIFKIDGFMEFDGMIYYKMTSIIPQNEKVSYDRIYLSIPVKENYAKYYFSTAGGWCPSYGEIDKENKVVWKSDEIADFVPYVCLSDDKIAIHWFADNDHNWIIGKDYPTAEILKRDKIVEIRINFVRKKGEIKDFSAEFGLIASPVKPLPSSWRNACLDSRPFANSKINFFYGPGHGGCPIDPHDSEKLAKAMGVYEEGKNPDEILINLPENYIDWSNPDILKNAEKVLGKNGVDFIKNWDKAKKDPNPYKVKRCYFFNASMYFEGYRSKAFQTFFPAEWTLIPSGWFHLTPVESYRDFFAFYMELWFRHWFVEGFYFDEVYHGPDYNVFNGNGKFMEDGSIRPSIPLMHQREFMKRMRQLFIDHKREPFIWVHSTNYMAPYAISPADVAMFGEDKVPIPGNDIIDTIPSLLLRTLGRSQKFGFIPVWMVQVGRSGLPWGFFSRQTCGWFWMHDVVPEYHTAVRGRPLIVLRQGWGIDRDDVNFIPFWGNKNYVSVNDDKFIVSIWTQPEGKVLLQVMNLHKPEENKTDVKISLNVNNLNLKKGFKIYDLESDNRLIEWENNLREAEKLQNQDPVKNKDKIKELTKDLNKLPETIKYEISNLQIISQNSEFIVSVPPRDFKVYVIE